MALVHAASRHRLINWPNDRNTRLRYYSRQGKLPCPPPPMFSHACVPA